MRALADVPESEVRVYLEKAYWLYHNMPLNFATSLHD